jgi:hypothetical protein
VSSLVDAVSVPDAVEPVVGWRAWGVDAATLGRWQAPTVSLCSIAFECQWPTGRPFTAECRKPVGKCLRSPASNCRCGIYAVHSPTQVFQVVGYRGPLVLGHVALWGCVVVGRRGWRAQYAYPRRLFVVDERGRDLGWVIGGLEAYGVPVCRMTRGELRHQAPTVPPAPGWWRRLLDSLWV